MTKRRARTGWARAMLVALTIGACLAGISQLLSSGSAIDGRPDGVALEVDSTSLPPAPPATTTSASVAPTAPPTVASATLSAPATTTPPPAPTSSAGGGPKPKPTTTTAKGDVGTQVLGIANNHRRQAGCPALTMDSRLSRAAQGHSDDMSDNDYFSHTSLDGRDFVDRATDAGYPSPGGENIARGQTSAQAVMTAWMNSSGHRANILNCDFRTMGLGFAPDGYYWTQMFGY